MEFFRSQRQNQIIRTRRASVFECRRFHADTLKACRRVSFAAGKALEGKQTRLFLLKYSGTMGLANRQLLNCQHVIRGRTNEKSG